MQLDLLNINVLTLTAEMESMAPLKLSKMEGKPFIDMGEDEDLKKAKDMDFSGQIIPTSNNKKPKAKGQARSHDPLFVNETILWSVCLFGV